ncbi:hypothetical protein BC342_00005 [Streptomyces olivaceus]|nr:hypothetical protein BC342_00005 [Streptomyces olivaceus]
MAPTLSYGLVGAFTPASLDAPDDEEFEDGWDEDEDPLGTSDDAGDDRRRRTPIRRAAVPRPSRIYDARQEATQW